MKRRTGPTDQIVVAGSITGGDDATVPYDEGRFLAEPSYNREPESDAEAEQRGDRERAKFWSDNIRAGLISEKRWREEALACERVSFGDDETTPQGATDSNALVKIGDKVALIHSNIEVLKPLLFSETPQPIVRRRFRGDGKSATDETALMAAEVGQRIADYILDTERFDYAMECVRDDRLIVGRGAARAMYSATFKSEPVLSPEGIPVLDATGHPATREVKASERVRIKHVPWSRLVIAPGHDWDEAPWIAFEVPMTRSQVERRFGAATCETFNFSEKGLAGMRQFPDQADRRDQTTVAPIDETGTPTGNVFDVAAVWEVWNRDDREILWWSPSCPDRILDEETDILGLEEFYPMPRPLMATTKSGSMNPRPDIRYYEGRAEEIDIATKKLKQLLKIISVSGLIPGDVAEEVKKILQGDNVMVAVSSWLGVMEKGGLSGQGMIQWLPLQQIIQAATALITMRDQAKMAMFEASGISDIMRAQGDPRETAAAQNLKGKYAGMRLADQQRAMAIYARDSLRIMVEIAVEHFSTETLADICGLDLPLYEAERQAAIAQQEQAKMTFQQMAELHAAGSQMPDVDPGPAPVPPPEVHIPGTSWELVHQRLRDDLKRKITISIETQSTVLADEQADKQARVEFIQAMASFVQTIMPMAMSGAFPMKTAKELLLFGIRGFPKSRTLESLIAQLPDEAPQQPEKQEETSITVAKIRAEVDLKIAEMRSADAEADRQQDIRMKGVDLIADAAQKKTDADNTPPPERKTPEKVEN
jgi:hypothetical protein